MPLRTRYLQPIMGYTSRYTSRYISRYMSRTEHEAQNCVSKISQARKMLRCDYSGRRNVQTVCEYASYLCCYAASPSFHFVYDTYCPTLYFYRAPLLPFRFLYSARRGIKDIERAKKQALFIFYALDKQAEQMMKEQ